MSDDAEELTAPSQPPLVDVHRLAGIQQLLVDPAFDESGHLANDDARYLLGLTRSLWVENQGMRAKLLAIDALRRNVFAPMGKPAPRLSGWDVDRQIRDILDGPKPSVMTDRNDP